MAEKIDISVPTKIATYNELMELTRKDPDFFFKDCRQNGRLYRIFTCKPMGWVSFTEPASMDCRGVMFDITNGDSSAILVSLPPRKFFEYEHDTRDHTLGRIGDKMVKLDGSLISTYFNKNKKAVCLKSKASLESPQVRLAESILLKNTALYKEIQSIVEQDYTINFELTSPRNRTGEGYVVEIILSDGTSYLTKVKNTSFLELEKKKKNPNLR